MTYATVNVIIYNTVIFALNNTIKQYKTIAKEIIS